jgi:hypothetical protein
MLANFGFRCSQKAYANARRHAQNHGAGAPLPKPPQPVQKQPLSPSQQQSIIQFLTEKSQPAANRTVTHNKSVIPVQCYNMPVSHLYSEYLQYSLAQNPPLKHISVSTFRKYIPKQFKRAKKKTDMCEICENSKKAIRIFRNMLQRIHERCVTCLHSPSLESWLDPSLERCEATRFFRLNQEDQTNLKKLREDLRMYLQHKKLREKQADAFKEQIKEIPSGECVLVVDFKENVKIGKGLVELNKDFYRFKSRTILGFVIYSNPSGQRIEKTHVNMVSEVLTHDGLFSSDALHQVIRTECANMKKVRVWTDCGPHFRCAEFANTLLVEVPKQNKIQMEWNFFAPYHGKNACDTHFSLLSRYLKTKEKQMHIFDTRSLIDAWEQSFRDTKKAKVSAQPLKSKQNKRLIPTTIKFVVYEPPARSAKRLLKIRDLKNFFCIWSRGGNVYGREMTDEKIKINSLSVQSKSVPDTRKTKRASDFQVLSKQDDEDD